MTTPSPDLVILRWLARRDHATASQIIAACAMPPGDVRARLASLESRRLVCGRQDKDMAPPQRVFFLTPEGRRKVATSDARGFEG